MKVGKKAIVFIALFVMIAILATGCRRPSDLIGTWEDDRGALVLELSSDGTGRSRWNNPAGFNQPEPPRGSITWEASDNTLIIRQGQTTFTGSFEIVGSSLVITNMNGHMNRTWTRQVGVAETAQLQNITEAVQSQRYGLIQKMYDRCIDENCRQRNDHVNTIGSTARYALFRSFRERNGELTTDSEHPAAYTRRPYKTCDDTGYEKFMILNSDDLEFIEYHTMRVINHFHDR